MHIRKLSSFILIGLCVLAASCAKTPATPTIALSLEKVPEKGHVEMRGTGFTPRANVKSHLRRPNDTEYPVLNILTDDKGEFTHDIDTLLMDVGTHEVWVEDANGVTSNTAKFEVTHGQAPGN